MKQLISHIAKELVKKNETIFNSYHLGLRNGLMGITLFYFYYARLTGDEWYEEIANYNLEKIFSGAHFYMNYFNASEFADIGKTTCLLRNENFLKENPDEIAKYFDEPLMKRLRKDLGLDFGFCSGITGICDYFLTNENSREALDITFREIYSALRVKGYHQNPVTPQTLFPPDILRDVKIFILKLEKFNIPIPDKKHLYKAIKKTESQKSMRNNCFEYCVLQDLREAVIMEDKPTIQSSLENIAANASNLIFKGLATLSLEDNSFSVWCSLV